MEEEQPASQLKSAPGWRKKRGEDEEGFIAPLGSTIRVEAEEKADMERTWTDLVFADVEESMRADFEASRAQDDVTAPEDAVDGQIDHWEAFYVKNQDAFFRDRTYFFRDFPELESLPQDAALHVSEWGCGAGNSIWPLAAARPPWTFSAFDCSETAVKLVEQRAHSEQLESRVKASCWDPSDASRASPLAEASCDLALCIFFLSALPTAEALDTTLLALSRAVKPGGLVIIRDYGQYDMTMIRFAKKKGRLVPGQEQYVFQRADGTLTRFFTQQLLDAAFDQVGFDVVRSGYATRELRNRKTKIKMYRNWVSCVYVVIQ